MLSLIHSPGPFLRIRATGRLRAGDYRRFERGFAAELHRRALPLPLLLDMRGFRGWTPAGFIRDLGWDLANRCSFSRIAVLGDRRWHGWITWLGRPLFRAPMRYFDSAASAEKWLARS
jgi:hypothetical protein